MNAQSRLYCAHYVPSNIDYPNCKGEYDYKSACWYSCALCQVNQKNI